MRVLILSADVAGGHDAAAKALAAEIATSAPGAEVVVENGLRLASKTLHHIVRDGYKLQITYASSTYALLFKVISVGFIARWLRRALATVFGRRFYRAVRSFDPDIIVSTYPVVTALLSEGRLRGALTMPVTTVITDVDPNLLCLAPGVDAHFVAVPNDVERVKQTERGNRALAARPPIRQEFLEPRSAAVARSALDLPEDRPVVLVSGGAWCVGHVDDVVQEILDRTNAFVLVACGTNERLRGELERRFPQERVRALPFWNDMPGLFAACDVLVHTGAGLTCLEAIACGLPVVLYHVLPGHGVQSAAALVEDGMVQWARGADDLCDVIQKITCDQHDAQQLKCHAAAMHTLPSLAQSLFAIEPASLSDLSQPSTQRNKRALASAAVLAVLLLRSPVSLAPVRWAYQDISRAAQLAKGHTSSTRSHVLKQSRSDTDASLGSR